MNYPDKIRNYTISGDGVSSHDTHIPRTEMKLSATPERSITNVVIDHLVPEAIPYVNKG